MWRFGICRTAAVKYNVANLDDKYAHLTNHCIQKEHPVLSSLVSLTLCVHVQRLERLLAESWQDYGKEEKGNEMFFDEFDEYLKVHHPGRSVEKDVFPAIEKVMRVSVKAVAW